MSGDPENRRRPSRRRSSILIDDEGRVWAPDRRPSSASKKTVVFEATTKRESEGALQEVHLGHDPELRRKSVTYLKKELEIDYHEIDLETLFHRYGTHPNQGLDEKHVRENLEKYGKNELTPPKMEPMWIKFLKTLVGGFQLILWIGSILCFGAYIAQCLTSTDPAPDNLYLGSVLAVLVIVLGIFTFYQEYSSGKVMESFAKMVPQFANVIRNGKLMNINAAELVVGDIIEVKFGDRIPADFRILEAQSFKVDNSSLTGESEAQSRGPQCTDENPLETKNLAFFSTNALEGTAKGVVVAVGDGTFIGRIAGLTAGMDGVDTPLSREVSYFIKLISGVAVFFGAVFFAASLILHYNIIDAVLFLIGIIVANVPEGLLVTFTVILALTAKRMAEKNCLVRQLHAVETLGSCSVICSDKTGTLTQNLMTASHFWFNDKIYEASPDAHEFEGEDPGFQALSRVAALCSRAKFLPEDAHLPTPDRKVSGDASESAILRNMDMHLGGIEKYQMERPKVFEIPFNSSNKWQLSIHEIKQDSSNGTISNLLVMKGAPERIVTLCTKIRIGDTLHDMDAAWKKRFNTIYETIGGMGERVIGFCEYVLPRERYPQGFPFNPDDIGFVNDGLTFVGLISMIDPPRPGVPNAVQTCRQAGIKVVMVTGDHPITAKAVARKVGIISLENETAEEMAKRLNVEVDEVDGSSCHAIVVNGADLLEMSTQELDDVLHNHSEIVFARVSPQQKLVIVEGFQRQGKIVAVTGDGVNDSPALKKADIGIAMGISGSDVSKQAADMILLDDNFSSIITGVEEGRLIFENLKKCICYLLCANIAELLPFAIYIVARIPLPLGTIPMLIICLGTDILPTISLSYQKAEGDIMSRPPRNPATEKLVTPELIKWSYGNLGVIEFFAGMFSYAVIMGQNGFWLPDLVGIQAKWDSTLVNDLKDSYGQEWTYYQRKNLEKTCWTGYFAAVVVCQWANVLVSKVRRAPLHKHLFDNWIVFAAIFGETLLSCILTYTPGLNYALSYRSIMFLNWVTATPFFFFLLIHDEVRRLILRTKPKWTWYQHEFNY